MGKKSKHLVGYGVVFLFFCILPSLARAGGVYLYEIGTPDLGLAGAGYAARAQDAATVHTNPAGMTRLDRSQLLMAIQPAYLDLSFSPDARTTQSGSDGSTSQWLPSGSLFYVQDLSPDWKFGIGVFGYFGMTLDYGSDWVGRYYLKDGTFLALAVEPSVAYKISDNFSIGLGMIANYVLFESNLAVNNRTLPDGELHLEDEDLVFQFNLGLLYELSKNTRFGLTYISEGEIDLSSRTEFTGLGPGLSGILNAGGMLNAELDLGMTMPQSVMFSAFHQLTDKWALLANLGWQDWSEFGKVDVTVSAENITSLTTDMEYDDTFHVAFGTQYRVAPDWLLTAGVAYDSSCMEDEQRSPTLPLGEAWRFAFGTQYQWSKDIDIGWAYEFMWGGDLDMDVNRGELAGRVAGTYENAGMHCFAVSLNWKF